MSEQLEERIPEAFPPGQGRFWMASNVVSLLRVVLTVPTIHYILAGPDYRWYMFTVVMMMIVSDILDGTLARARKEITEWGKVIDPVADKVAIDSIAIVLWYDRGLPLWIVLAVVGRDVLILVGGLLLTSRIKNVPSANRWGKATTFVMAFLLLTYGMDYDPPKPYLLPIAGFLIAVSFVSYAYRFRALNRSTSDDEVSD